MKLIVKCVADDGSEWDTIEEAQTRDAEVKAAREANIRAKARREFPEQVKLTDSGPMPPAVP